MLIIVGHLTVDASEIDAFAADFRALCRAAHAVDGNLAFDCAVDEQGRVLVVEKWRDKAALDAFIALPILAAFFATWGAKMKNELRKFDAHNERAPQA